MASPGYGKRSAPDQRPPRADDFAHLPAREASIAAYLDRLPEGADISVKTLAKGLPDHGQCAVGTVLRRLSEAGHLRHGREQVTGAGGPRWVTRTYFSRTARDDTWWAAFIAGERSGNGPEPRPEPAAVRPPVVLRLVECTVCGTPGRPDALPGGLCRECRGAPPPRPTGPSAARVRARVDRLRAAARREPEGGTLRAGTPPARSRPSCA
ncbi:hypothetical protein [Streptomyces megasporus]|uniref:hypothetical protein n=1 Tax=Streptomyces megasporus TaxID=44060 RepID=UPI00068DB5C5|nr:hypothetical protein [Streptomyces megasporus]